jgi:hypothetical protein
MSEERKILELLSSGQINVDEAEGLLEALRDLPNDKDEAEFSKELRRELGVHDSVLKAGEPRRPRGFGMHTLSGRLLKFNLYRGGHNQKKLDLQVPVEYARRLDGMIPKDVQEVIASQGVTLQNVLAAAHASEGRILDLHVGGDNETTITLEVTS